MLMSCPSWKKWLQFFQINVTLFSNYRFYLMTFYLQNFSMAILQVAVLYFAAQFIRALSCGSFSSLKKKIKQSRVSAKIHFLTAYEHHKPSRIPFLDMNGSEREKYFKIFNIFLNQFFVSYPGHLKPLKCKCYLCVQMSSIIESGECIHVYLKTKYFGILLKISTKLVSSNYFLPKL